MLNILSLLIGLFALMLALFAFLPFLGWANWLIIPVAAIGLALGAMSRRNAGRNLAITVIALSTLRLTLGGGII